MLFGIDATLKAKGLTRQELADYLHITPSGLSKYIRGDREPPFDTLVKMCAYLNISIDTALGLQPKEDFMPDDEKILLDRYRHLSDDGKEILRAEALKMWKDYPLHKV